MAAKRGPIDNQHDAGLLADGLDKAFATIFARGRNRPGSAGYRLSYKTRFKKNNDKHKPVFIAQSIPRAARPVAPLSIPLLQWKTNRLPLGIIVFSAQIVFGLEKAG
ncbi:hypothetical protein DPQ22_06040 [Candidatus Tokpelaia sp.]|nr:hypothetical protein DPQ22_06040 [Candidatus Tokpelaia sp.]